MDKHDLLAGAVIVGLVVGGVAFYLAGGLGGLRSRTTEVLPILECTHVNDGYFWCESEEESRYMYVSGYSS